MTESALRDYAVPIGTGTTPAEPLTLSPDRRRALAERLEQLRRARRRAEVDCRRFVIT